MQRSEANGVYFCVGGYLSLIVNSNSFILLIQNQLLIRNYPDTIAIYSFPSSQSIL